MNADHYYCDRCGAKTEHRFFVTTGREMDPSGNGYQDEGFNADLCCGCIKAGLEHMLSRWNGKTIPDHEQGDRFKEWFDAGCNKRHRAKEKAVNIRRQLDDIARLDEGPDADA